MDESADTFTPTQSRTRTAILKAALSVFTVDQSAPLSEVAKRAEVARSTLHRYFPERSDLTTALTEYAQSQATLVAEKSRLDEGSAVDALVRVALEYFEHWESVMWSYLTAFPNIAEPQTSGFEFAINERIKSGQQSGEIDAGLPGDWFQHTMFAIIYSAWEYERAGNTHTEAAMMVMATMRKMISPAVSPVVPPVR